MKSQACSNCRSKLRRQPVYPCYYVHPNTQRGSDYCRSLRIGNRAKACEPTQLDEKSVAAGRKMRKVNYRNRPNLTTSQNDFFRKVLQDTRTCAGANSGEPSKFPKSSRHQQKPTHTIKIQRQTLCQGSL